MPVKSKPSPSCLISLPTIFSDLLVDSFPDVRYGVYRPAPLSLLQHVAVYSVDSPLSLGSPLSFFRILSGSAKAQITRFSQRQGLCRRKSRLRKRQKKNGVQKLMNDKMAPIQCPICCCYFFCYFNQYALCDKRSSEHCGIQHSKSHR